MSSERLSQKTQNVITGILLLFAAFPVILLFEGWTGAVVGFAMMFWGLMLSSKPLAPLLVSLPYAGPLIQKGVLRFALAVAAALTLVFLMVQWLWYILLAVCLVLLIGALCLWLLRSKIPWLTAKTPKHDPADTSAPSRS